MNNSFATICTEVMSFLESLPDNKKSKIPENIILYYKNNRDLNYQFEIDKSKSLEQQNFSKKAVVYIVAIYKKYIATEQELMEINSLLNKNASVSEQVKRDMYSNNVFLNKEENSDNKKIDVDNKLIVRNNGIREKAGRFWRKIKAKFKLKFRVERL